MWGGRSRNRRDGSHVGEDCRKWPVVLVLMLVLVLVLVCKNGIEIAIPIR